MPVFDSEALDAMRDAGVQINVVCTHMSPSFAEPHTKDGISCWLREDAALEEDIHTERETMDQLWNRLREDGHPLQTWCYGHYHYHHAEEHEGVVFRLLDMCHNSNLYDMVEVR